MGSPRIVNIFGGSESSQGFVSGTVSWLRSVFTVFSRSASTFMTKLSFLRLFFISLRFTGSSGGGTGVTGRFGDFTVSRFFTNTFSCVSVRFSPRLVLDVPGVVVVVSGS